MCDAQDLKQIRQPLGTGKHHSTLTQNWEHAQLKIWIRLHKKTKADKNITLEDVLIVLELLEAKQRDLGHTLLNTCGWTGFVHLARENNSFNQSVSNE